LADISLAHEIFNYIPRIDLEQGIAEYIQWAKNNAKNEDAK
jgi:nucleoside-diphosphate-sugar epimerase